MASELKNGKETEKMTGIVYYRIHDQVLIRTSPLTYNPVFPSPAFLTPGNMQC